MNLGDFKLMWEADANRSVMGNVSISVISQALINANLAFFKKQAGIEDAPNDGPYWQKCQQVTDALSPFILGMGENGNSFMQVDSKGYADVPSDYFMYSSLTLPVFSKGENCEMIEKEYPIDMLTDQAFQSRVTSVRKQPTNTKPICTSRNGKFRFAPKNILRAKMVYLRKPATPVFDYTEIDGVYVYLPPGQFHNGTIKPNGTPSASVEFEWPEKCHIDLYYVFASFLSDSLRIRDTKQTAETFKRTGQ